MYICTITQYFDQNKSVVCRRCRCRRTLFVFVSSPPELTIQFQQKICTNPYRLNVFKFK